MIRYYDKRELDRELYVERETELYELNREYDEWKVRLEVCLNNNDLIYNTKVTNPILEIFTDGDLTEILNVDLMNDDYDITDKLKLFGYDTQDNNMYVNKIEQCYIKQRLIFDDGG